MKKKEKELKEIKPKEAEVKPSNTETEAPVPGHRPKERPGGG